jgi:hypothetical protein
MFDSASSDAPEEKRKKRAEFTNCPSGTFSANAAEDGLKGSAPLKGILVYYTPWGKRQRRSFF